jgi:hypothetical protein
MTTITTRHPLLPALPVALPRVLPVAPPAALPRAQQAAAPPARRAVPLVAPLRAPLRPAQHQAQPAALPRVLLPAPPVGLPQPVLLPARPAEVLRVPPPAQRVVALRVPPAVLLPAQRVAVLQVLPVAARAAARRNCPRLPGNEKAGGKLSPAFLFYQSALRMRRAQMFILRSSTSSGSMPSFSSSSWKARRSNFGPSCSR